MDSVLSCLVTDQLGPGMLSTQLVRKVAEYLGMAGGIAVREYPRAIKIVFEALNFKPGDKVILTPLYPPSYAQVALEMGIIPIYLDVDPSSGCLSFENLQRIDLKSIKGLVVHSPLGLVPALEKFAEVGLPIIEDITQGLGASVKEKRLGSFGSFALISMEPDGIFTAGGGVIVLGKGRKEVSTLQKLIEPFQQDILLPDFNAALGITQIERIERFLSKRMEIAHFFLQSLLQTKHKTLVQQTEGEQVYYSFPILVSSGLKDVQAYCKKQGVDTALAFSYSIAGKGLLPEGDWPASRSLCLRCMLFPLYPSLTKLEIEHLQKVLTTMP